MEVALVLFASLNLTALVVVLCFSAQAPFGYEDDRGFHQTETEPVADAVEPSSELRSE